MELIHQLQQAIPREWNCWVAWEKAPFTNADLHLLFSNPSQKKRLQRQWGHKAAFHALSALRHEGIYLKKPFGIAYRPTGRPYVLNNEEILDLSISHSHHIAVASVTRAYRTGIDIERLEESSVNLLDFFMDEQERRILKAMDGTLMPRIAWSIKEAVIKMIGVGLSGNQNHVKISEVIKPQHVHVRINWDAILEKNPASVANPTISSCLVVYQTDPQFVVSVTAAKPSKEE
jgi:phosphopantetheinyl transferase